MKNQWIKWADRDDLECAYLIVTHAVIKYRDINDEGDTESYTVSNDFIYILGKVPNEYFDKIIDRAWTNLADSNITYVEIKTESQICHDDKLNAMRDYEQRKAEKHYLTVLETVQYYQNKDYLIFTYHKKFLDEISAHTSTASQPNPAEQPKPEQTDTPNQTRAASSSNEKEPPKQPRAGAGSSEQPKRKKASEKDVLEAMDLLRKRAETPNITDWENGTITLFLRDKGYSLELSKKTKIGKYWAIIYEHKKETPPPHWKQSDVQKARDDLSRDGINFDWFL